VSDDNFLSRWSRKKHEAKAAPAAPAPVPAAGAVPTQAGTHLPAVTPAEEKAPAPLPPVESLTPESDFSPFMKAEVDPATRRQALKTLFQDPRYNVMDGLDVYIDDYSKPDPLPEGWLEKMNQVARLGDFRPKEPPEGEEVEKPAESAQLAQNPAEEQPVAPLPDANSSDTPIKGPAASELDKPDGAGAG
jgi:hypothetical protein